MGDALMIEPLAVSGSLAASLSLLGKRGPKQLYGKGARELLDRSCLGFLCSARSPGEAILAAYEVSRRLDVAGQPVLGGFHSPMEKQFLEILLVRHVPAVVCVPRPLAGMRIPLPWRKAMEEGRLLVVSASIEGNRRFSRPMAEMRNVLVGAVADPLFVPYATPGGSIEKLLTLCAGWGKRVLTVRCNEQQVFRAAGAGIIEEWLLAQGRREPERRLVLV